MAKQLSFRVFSASGEGCRVTPSLGRVTSSIAREKPLLMIFQIQHF